MSANKSFSVEDFRDLAAGLAHTFGNYGLSMDLCITKIWESLEASPEDAKEWLMNAKRMNDNTMYFARAFEGWVFGHGQVALIPDLAEFVERSIEEASLYYEAEVGRREKLDVKMDTAALQETKMSGNFSIFRYAFQSLAFFALCGRENLTVNVEPKDNATDIIFEVPTTEYDPDDLEKLFHPYQQNGSHLGLFISRKSLEALGMGTVLIKKKRDKLQLIVRLFAPEQ